MVLGETVTDPDFRNMIVWSDEATFKLNGRLNHHNSIYWAEENPHQILQHDVKLLGVTVWASFSARLDRSILLQRDGGW